MRNLIRKSAMLILLLFVPNSMLSFSKKQKLASEILKSVSSTESVDENNIIEEPATLYGHPHKSAFLGRPTRFIAKLLHWDKTPQFMGPLVSRLIKLNKELLENTNIVQSIVMQGLGLEPEVYKGEDY